MMEEMGDWENPRHRENRPTTTKRKIQALNGAADVYVQYAMPTERWEMPLINSCFYADIHSSQGKYVNKNTPITRSMLCRKFHQD